MDYRAADGEKIFATFKKDKPTNLGLMITPDQKSVFGNWDGYDVEKFKLCDDSLTTSTKNCYKTMSNSMQLYVGQALNQIPHGLGAMTFKSGDEYFGQFKEGNFHGFGVMVLQDGRLYFGEYIDNGREGIGELFYQITHFFW